MRTTHEIDPETEDCVDSGEEEWPEGAFPRPLSQRRFGDAMQRDGAAQERSFLSDYDIYGDRDEQTVQVFTAEGTYCMSYAVEFTSPVTGEPVELTTQLRYAVGDDISSDAACGSTEKYVPEPVGEVTLRGQAYLDANGNGVRDEDEEALSGLDVMLSPNIWSRLPEDEYVEDVFLTTDENGWYEARVRTSPPPGREGPATWSAVVSGIPEGIKPLGREMKTNKYGVRQTQAAYSSDLTVDGAEETIDFPFVEIKEGSHYVLQGGHADVLFPELERDDLGMESLVLRGHADAVNATLDYDDFVIHLHDPGYKLPSPYRPGADYSFIGPERTMIWNAGEGGGEPWIGAAMQSPSLNGLPKDQLFSFSLDAVTGPGGTQAPGDVVLWSGYGTRQKPDVTTMSGPARARNFILGSHSHFNWSFTAEGVYCLAFSVQSPGTDGKLLRDQQQLTLVVGENLDPEKVEPCGRTQPYPQQRLNGEYQPASESVPVVTKPVRAVSSVAGVRLANDELVVESLRWLRGSPKITANPVEASIFYTPQVGEGVYRSPEHPYPVNMPNWDTSAIASNDIQGNARFEITKVDGPGELFASSPIGADKTPIDTAVGKTSLEMWPASESYNYDWEVTRPGKYCVTGQWTANTASGETVKTTKVITLVTDGPLDPNDYHDENDVNVSSGEVWVASEHGALDATCEQDPNSYTRASEVPIAGDVDPNPTKDQPWNVANWAKTESGALILNLGHIDVASLVKDSTLDTKIKDTTNEGVQNATELGAAWHEPEDVVLQLLPASKSEVPDLEEFSFLGEAGGHIWQVNQAQDDALLWPGWSTEHIADGVTPGGVEWTLKDAKGPGSFFLYQSDITGPKVYFNTADGVDTADSFTIPEHTHAHGSWAFTQQGVYCLAFERTATIDGVQQTDPFTLAVAVGETDPTKVDPANCQGSEPAPVVTVPAAPAAPVATVDGTSVNVSWVAPADGGSAITGYVVTLTGDKGEPIIQNLGAGVTSAVFANVPEGTYTATVAAVNAKGNSEASPASAPVTVKAEQKPNPGVDPSDKPRRDKNPVTLTPDKEPAKDAPKSGGLPNTGTKLTVPFAGAVVLLVVGGMAVLGGAKRRRETADSVAE